MSKIKVTNLTEGFLIVNSIQINNNKLAIPPKAEAIIDAEYQEDSHIQELTRMKKIKVCDYTQPAAIQEPVKKKSHHKAKPAKDEPKTEDEISNQEGSKVTFMTDRGSPKKGEMVNSILDQEPAKKNASKGKDKGPLIDEQTDEDDPTPPSEAFVNV
jgi:hypothetical protein